MWLPKNSTKTAKFCWVEVARYVPSLERVIREKTGPKDDRRPVLVSWDEVYEYAQKHDNTGIYTSVFRYDSTDLDNARRLGNLYFDFDSEEIEVAHSEAKRLYQYLREFLPTEAIRRYFTGAKGFHLEVEAVALGVDARKDLADIYRFIAERLNEKFQLTTLDFAVYDLRRMWRLPFTKHQKTGLYKTSLRDSEFVNGTVKSILHTASFPWGVADPPPQTFLPKANQWYKELVSQRDELLEQKALERIEMFNRFGTSLVGKPSDNYARIVWDGALDALRNAEAGKNRNQTLNRQAFRLYLLAEKGSLSEEHITQTLTEIGLGIGLDNGEIASTLDSARSAARKKAESNGR